MERKKKSIAPSGSVHDIKYLYAVIQGIGRKGGKVKSDRTGIEYFGRLVNEYNYAKSSKFGFSLRPREVNQKLISHVVTELIYLKLIRKEDKSWVLTGEGEEVASFIENQNSRALKTYFTKLLFDSYKVFEYFVGKIKDVSNGDGVPIPSLSASAFDRCNGEFKCIADKYVEIGNGSCSGMNVRNEKLHQLIDTEELALIDQRTEKIKKLQAILEKFFVTEAFGPMIQNRRAYDFVRSRTTSMEITNYAIFQFDEFPAEVTYLVSDKEQALDETDHELKESIVKTYSLKKDAFGYVKVADMRDHVCRELRIPDRVFDENVKRIYRQEPHWLSFTYSGADDRITEKRLPIVLEKPMRELFTLMKIN
jgi:hypothetical protein